MAPGRGTKRIQHLKAARMSKKLKGEIKKLSEADWDIDQYPDLLARIDIEEAEEQEEEQEEQEQEEEEEEEEDITDSEEDAVAIDICAFEILVEGSRVNGIFDRIHFNYQQGPDATIWTHQRRVKTACEL